MIMRSCVEMFFGIGSGGCTSCGPGISPGITASSATGTLLAPRLTSSVHPSFMRRCSVGASGGGAVAFDDPTGAVSGAWVIGRPPAATPGLLIYIWCGSVAATVDAVVAHGGEIIQP